jgi:hypothetical protein
MVCIYSIIATILKRIFVGAPVSIDLPGVFPDLKIVARNLFDALKKRLFRALVRGAILGVR